MRAFRIGLIGLAFLLTFSMNTNAYAMTTIDKEETYKASVRELETYLENGENDSGKLIVIATSFEELRGYDQSKFFGYYVSVLMKVENEEYDYELNTYIDMLNVNSMFIAYLEDLRKTSPIGTVEELIAYIAARENEHSGNLAKARDGYKQCINFFDSDKRYMRLKPDDDRKAYESAKELLRQGDYAGAYFQFASSNKYSDSVDMMASIVNQLGYTPESPDDNLNPAADLMIKETNADSLCLSWPGSLHAKNYEVYYKHSENDEWIIVGNTDSTEMIVEGLQGGNSYDFQVIASIGRIKARGTVLQNEVIALRSSVNDYEVGNYVMLGSYPQTIDRKDNTPIEWLVLEKQGNKALLISRYILDSQPYNGNNSQGTWEKCTLRAWLNTTFLNTAFNGEEQDSILVASIDNSKAQGSVDWDTYDEKNTLDKVFLLSIKEVYHFFPNNEARKCAPTNYAVQKGVTTGTIIQKDGRTTGGWWLRSRRKDELFKAGIVTGGGVIGIRHVRKNEYGVRPAIWVNLDAEIYN